jgi:UDP-3-O-[3-hydroxymyristoyl] glucosamine N-acyltransferase
MDGNDAGPCDLRFLFILMSHSISELAKILGLPCQGDESRQLSRVSGWDEADGRSLIFLETRSKKDPLPESLPAGCIIAPRDLVRTGWSAIISDKPKLDFARAARFLCPRPVGTGERHNSSTVSPQAKIGKNVDMGPCVSIAAGASIGDGCILQTGVVVGENCRLGQQCILHPRVILYPGAEIGNRVTLQAGVVVGGDGFGYVFDGQRQEKFPQVGRVVIEDDVEIGCNTTIDRGSLGTTRIGTGAKIDNLVQIGHNVQIGRGVVIAAQTGISGSTVIEDFAIIGGQVGFGDHARVESGAIIGSKAGVLPGKIVRAGEVYWGVPVRPLREYKRLNALFGRLPEMKAEIDALGQAVERLEQAFRNLDTKKVLETSPTKRNSSKTALE